MLNQAPKKVLSFCLKSTIIFDEKYYRFTQKVLSFLMESTIVFNGKYYRFLQKLISTSRDDSMVCISRLFS